MIQQKLANSLAAELFNIGAVKFGSFKLKLHEKNPDAPLSPIFFNFRTADNPKPGPLSNNIINRIAQAMYGIACQNQIKYDCLAGVPRAGDPFASAFSFTPSSGISIPLLTLGKKEEGDRRWVEGISGNFQSGQKVLLIDDLITGADSKLEAIQVLEDAGLEIAGIIVILDREQGGVSHLKKLGYTIFSIFSLFNLLDIYVHQEKIDEKKFQEVKDYISSNQVSAPK